MNRTASFPKTGSSIFPKDLELTELHAFVIYVIDTDCSTYYIIPRKENQF